MLFIVTLILSVAIFGWSETLSDVAAVFAQLLAWTLLFIAAIWYLAPINGLLAIAVGIIILGLAVKKLLFF